MDFLFKKKSYLTYNANIIINYISKAKLFSLDYLDSDG